MTRDEAAEVKRLDADLHLSGNRTCEIGLHHATGHGYESPIMQKFVGLAKRNFVGAVPKAKKSVHKLHK